MTPKEMELLAIWLRARAAFLDMVAAGMASLDHEDWIELGDDLQALGLVVRGESDSYITDLVMNR